MKVLLVEPYMTGSHAQWAKALQEQSSHEVSLLTLPGRYWKWRMHGGAIECAEQYFALPDDPDLIVCSDMLDVTTFLSLTRKRTSTIPVALYFHENQLTYPWSKDDRDIQKNRDHHYAFINYTSALAVDELWFNSSFHQDSFLGELPRFLNHFPDLQGAHRVEQLIGKSRVLPVGLPVEKLDEARGRGHSLRGEAESFRALLLWNHRWEYDKNPAAFFRLLEKLAQEEVGFGVVLLGENFEQHPDAFEAFLKRYPQHIVHAGYCESFEEYAAWLWACDIVPVTSNQEFFGVSVLEAAVCETTPVVPNRLSYPEVLRHEQNSWYFYECEQALFEKVRALCRCLPTECAKRNLADTARRFCWKKVITEYDNVFSSFE